MYSNTDILRAIDNRTIKISPYNVDQLGTNSYDVRLGNTFYEVFWDSEGPFFVGPYIYLDGDRVDIPIGGTLLGTTHEHVGTHGKIVAELRSRSTIRRVGITTNCDAGLGDVGYNDVWTMEFSAFTDMRQLDILLRSEPIFSLPFLIVGETVAQMVFFECKSEPSKEYGGQYQSGWPINMIPRKYRHRVIFHKDQHVKDNIQTK